MGLLDLQDVVLHVMLPRVREFYSLEKLIYSEVKDQVRADEVAKAFADARGLDELTVAKCGFSQASSHEKRVPVSAVKARIEQLSAMGFTKVKKLNVAELNTDSTEEILLAAGYAHWFDVETGQSQSA